MWGTLALSIITIECGLITLKDLRWCSKTFDEFYKSFIVHENVIDAIKGHYGYYCIPGLADKEL